MDNKTLYRPQFEHDSCGIGIVAHLKGKPSRDIIDDAITMLQNMEHRGGTGADENSGDGAGILIQIPHKFFKEECTKAGFKLPAANEYGIGMTFFPADDVLREKCRKELNKYIRNLGFDLLGYRLVPTERRTVGYTAISVEPVSEQFFITPKEPMAPDALERRLCVLRKYANRTIHELYSQTMDSFYISTCSAKTIVYKGQLTTSQLKPYFTDLSDERVISALALVHSRFSTNTAPKWKLAQPFRYIAHNGEINTIQGNVNWMKSKATLLKNSLFTPEELNLLLPICDSNRSDSSNLDNVVEVLTLSGRPMAHVMMMLIPEAWERNNQMSQEKRDFYEYHASMMEPWDGPASICFTDGNIVGATLDRNGLRPSRYLLTTDDKLVMSSEAGALPVDQSKVLFKGRLEPGKMFIADLEQGRIISDEEVKHDICSKQPYGKWLRGSGFRIKNLPDCKEEMLPLLTDDALEERQLLFGYTSEDLKVLIGPMAAEGEEPLGSMGADTPLAVLSQHSQHLANYFKQSFAQVSNPPIDPIRERMVMSLFSGLGPTRNILGETPQHCNKIKLSQPVISNQKLHRIKNIKHADFRCHTIHAVFYTDEREGGLENAIDSICKEAIFAVKEGYNIILISDRSAQEGMAPIPSLLACGAVHHCLIKHKIRSKTGIVIEGGDIVETHHFATLLGYGAGAINPYMALETIEQLTRDGYFEDGVSAVEAEKNYAKAVGKGLLKVFSKMGISTLQSYQGAQIFEALGISTHVVDKCFKGTTTRIEGMSFDDLSREVLVRHDLVYKLRPTKKKELPVGGVYQWKQRGEFHLFNPETIHLLQQACRKNDVTVYRKYADKINDQSEKACTLRSMFQFKERASIPLSEVEPRANILKRFATGAMSFGSISYEAHSTLAIAMNRINGRSNSGEGGEDEARFEKKPNGDWERSAIKQIASGRFGVTINYLNNAVELQIKMAQGAKPGEGGQLPGHKVDEWIGRVRHSTPGVGLISPPPHHDIYSIEDLAQLIFDLKNANPKARVNVKLVSEAGVGTIAAGVAKAKADAVLISGADGGTGASPLSSLRHAGLPWELGLAEAHQTLVQARLRSRMVLQTDGQIRTGRDLAIATLLGAEEWGVATAALVVEGCIMMRKCHTNTCPVGVATQNPELRKLFTGKADEVVNLFHFLADDLRRIMAQLGFRTINEMVGQANVLKINENPEHWKLKNLNLKPIIQQAALADGDTHYNSSKQKPLDQDVLAYRLKEVARPAIEQGIAVKAEFPILNIDRTVGTLVSSDIALKYGSKGLPENSIDIKFNGSAGQSFGAFSAKGIRFELEGEANDYFGKGLSGATLVVYPDRNSKFVPHENIVIGNVAFYGATSGKAYINGVAGERFCVRNSGAEVVVEGIGDHGCEYMTGGRAVILGATGRNFAAGMSGGVAYVFDPNDQLAINCNMGLVELETPDSEQAAEIKSMMEKHVEQTNSVLATSLLKNWKSTLNSFKTVMPMDYKRALEAKKSNTQKAHLTNG
ncbi:MAG: glutamate synthase large subunit [Flavobacteriales bacterium]|nr:glutamate synthase large subunit [Flavobacteriales bacterium]